MEVLCEKCKRTRAEHTLEITLMSICTLCYKKIIIQRIKKTLKNARVPNYTLCPYSSRFFSDSDVQALFNNIIEYHSMGENRICQNSDNAISILVATKECMAIMLLSYITSQREKHNNDNKDDELHSIIEGIGNGSIIVPLYNTSISEARILLEDNEIGFSLNHQDRLLYETIKEMEKTHKDASSGLTKSLMELSEIITKKR
ncbi:MAG: hypothetical protein ACMXYL_02035 [Candidatus Woesearchaeota archaeon]